MARFLITGGAGFIGSHLCEHFLGQGHEVICMDNYSTGAKENVSSFARNPRFRFVDHRQQVLVGDPGERVHARPQPARQDHALHAERPTPR